ncbi:Hypothetical protein Minf_1552 [Methylacidiphilum infernorum V4]|uniref:Uncharacterized protein n=1 Tax=Methylacidiphilum infernorum (isolate V4) TaxID=481448 RepID=B3DWA3_METI4|nr:Hypothetical protein Minf_1552 [Methylacidiphilum infernorum V4]
MIAPFMAEQPFLLNWTLYFKKEYCSYDSSFSRSRMGSQKNDPD